MSHSFGGYIDQNGGVTVCRAFGVVLDKPEVFNTIESANKKYPFVAFGRWIVKSEEKSDDKKNPVHSNTKKRKK